MDTKIINDSPVIDKLADIIMNQKEKNFSAQAMLVAVEGLSNTGKSTFTEILDNKISGSKFNCAFIEGDKFHYGKNIAMPIYESILKDLESGGLVPPNFPELIWNYDKMNSQLIRPIAEFNKSTEKETKISLLDVLKDKINGTEHDERYDINRNSLVLVSAMYLRHIKEFNYVVTLEADLDVLVNRKIARTQAVGFKRDPEISRKMISLIEYPIMMEHLKNNPVANGITLNTTDFNNLYLK